MTVVRATVFYCILVTVHYNDFTHIFKINKIILNLDIWIYSFWVHDFDDFITIWSAWVDRDTADKVTEAEGEAE